MSTAALVSVDEYLRTTYEPDCDYVEGVLEARNVGTFDHSRLQAALVIWTDRNRHKHDLKPLIAVRMEIAAARYRVPDVCFLRPPIRREPVLTTPPYVCIEVLSLEDRFVHMQQRFDDYLALGIPNVWVIDPITKRAWRITREGYFEALDGMLRTHDNAVALSLAELFSEDY